MKDGNSLDDIKNPKFWHELYIEKEANPFDKRTDKQFCEDIQMSIQNLEQWKRKHRTAIFQEVGKRRNQYLNEVRSVLWKSLAAKMATSKGVDAEKLAAQLMGDLVEKHESKVEMTDAEKQRRIQSLREGLQGREKAWKVAGTGEDRPSSEGHGPDASKLGGNDEGTAS